MQRRASASEELKPKVIPGYFIFPMDKLSCSLCRDLLALFGVVFFFFCAALTCPRSCLDCIERLIPRPAVVFWGVSTFLASFSHKNSQSTLKITFLTGLSGRFIITALPTIYQ